MPIARGPHFLYTVRPGDTLYSIANQFGIDVPMIVEMNALYPPITDPNLIRPGQVLLVRMPGMAEASTVQYAIQPGDTLYRLALRFQTSVDLLLGLNPLITDPDFLRVGQIILLPAFVYEVTEGDTVFKIAEQSGTSIGALIEANRGRIGFSPDVIYPGFRVVVPRPTSVNIAVFQPAPGEVIESGYPLSGIARAFEAVIQYQIRDSRYQIVTRERAVMTSAGGPAYGQFAVQMTFDQAPTTPEGFVWVYTRSARDGSIQDLVTIPVGFGH